MRIRIQVLIEADQEAVSPHIEEVACFERGPLSPETLGLRLDEAKQMLARVQQVMTENDSSRGTIPSTQREARARKDQGISADLC
jgi:cell shape-determining protein MreC